MKNTVLLKISIFLLSFLIISCGDKKSPFQDNEPVIPPTDELVANAGPDTTIYAGSFLYIDCTKSSLPKSKNYPRFYFVGDTTNPGEFNFENNYPKMYLGFINAGTYKIYLSIKSDEKLSAPDTLNVNVLPRENQIIPDIYLEYSIRLSNNFYDGGINKSYLEKIESVYIYNDISKIETLAGIEYCKNLKYLSIECQSITDISHLALVSSLEYLKMSPLNPFPDLEPVKNLYNLKYLIIGDLRSGDLSPVEKLTGLKYLSLGRIPDGHSFKNLINLETFITLELLDGDLSFLKNMTKMKDLMIVAGSGIKDISPLQSMLQLENLILRLNIIENIDALKNCTKLRNLNLGTNKIRDISALENLSYLKVLDLKGNKVSNIKPLMDNIGIGETREIYLNGNPLDSLSVNTYIPQLIEKGIKVEY